jgi:hypothetical protein
MLAGATGSSLTSTNHHGCRGKRAAITGRPLVGG